MSWMLSTPAHSAMKFCATWCNPGTLAACVAAPGALTSLVTAERIELPLDARLFPGARRAAKTELELRALKHGDRHLASGLGDLGQCSELSPAERLLTAIGCPPRSMKPP
jgi:hypothetical protein